MPPMPEVYLQTKNQPMGKRLACMRARQNANPEDKYRICIRDRNPASDSAGVWFRYPIRIHQRMDVALIEDERLIRNSQAA